MKKYVLNEKHEAIQIENVLEWAEKMEAIERRVAETWVGKYRVSTVFLGLDHSFSFQKGPILFETMVFDYSKPLKISLAEGLDFTSYPDVEQQRYSNWDEAIHGHFAVVEDLSNKK